MPSLRHQWIAESHTPDPWRFSLARPITITSSEDEDIEWTPAGQDSRETLAVSRHDFMFPYRNSDGEVRTGRGRIWLPPDSDGKDRSIPLVLSIHYVGDVNWARGFLSRGMAAVTPIEPSQDHLFNLVGEGMDHTIAMAQLVRRLPFVDLQRIIWTGGSAGGYQCLMTLTALWPVACAEANVPISDIAYNTRYLTHANRYNLGITDTRAMPVPVVNAVTGIAESTTKGFGEDEDSAWQHSVPPAVALIRSPAIIHSATGDLLCPTAQIGAEFDRPAPRSSFPPGWDMSYDHLCNANSHRKRLIEWIPTEDIETFCVAIPEGTREVQAAPPENDGVNGNEPTEPVFNMIRPFSRERLVSIVIQDEGPPQPWSGHTRYHVEVNNFPCCEYHLSRGYVPPEHMNALILHRLMQRFSEDVPANLVLPPVRRMDGRFDKFEVVLALRTFIGDPAREENLHKLREEYSSLPPSARVLDVTQDGVTAPFADDIEAGLAFHAATLLRQSDDIEAAIREERRLATTHGSAFASLKTTK
jgi:hypothetical protein